MDFYETIFELIDLRSFSNLWFWIMLAIMWSTASHYVIGVPFDMLTRAARDGGEDQEELLELVRINANRITYIADSAGSWLIAIVFFVISGLITSGFFYDVEFCQALFFLLGPMSLVFALSVRTARRITGLNFEATRTRMKNHRLIVQIFGMICILLTSMWGMYVNLTTGVLGA